MNTKSLVVGWVSLLLGAFFIGGAHATNYTLVLVAQGSGAVTPDNTNSTHPAGVNIEITATPAAGWYFDHWSGNASGNTNPLAVVMNSDLVITGNFLASPSYTFSLATNGQGSIALNPTGGSYYSNTVVTATATAAIGWVFTGWSGALTGATNPASFTVDTNVALTGTFAELPAFTSEPASVTNTAGGNVSFSVQAVGAAPLSYLWFFGGQALSAATSAVLSLTDVNSSEAGNYWVVITNNYGSATSSVATLTISSAAGPTNVVTAASEGSLLAAIARGGWVGLQFNGALTLTNPITITNDLVLDGSSYEAVISGGNAVQLFYVTNGASLTLSNLTLADGAAASKAIGAVEYADGGAIYNEGGNVTLVGCRLTNNSASSSTEFMTVGRGGAVFNNGGTVSLYGSTLAGNTASGGSGGAIYSASGWVTLWGCSVLNNESSSVEKAVYEGPSMGGGLFQASGTMAISNCILAFNQAAGSSAFPEIPTSGAGDGGAVAVAGGSLSVALSQFASNSAVGGGGEEEGGAVGNGGGIYCAATGTINGSTFNGNQAIGGSGSGGNIPGNGGAIYNDTAGVLVLISSAVYGNQTTGGQVASGHGNTVGSEGLGAGVFNAGLLTATNCTIALNSAIGGSAYANTLLGATATTGNAYGGGLYNAGGSFVGMNLTIASNSCSSPAGSQSVPGLTTGSQIANVSGVFHLHNSLIAYGATTNAYGTIIDDGYNICSDASASLESGSSYNSTDPLLGPLGNFGGPTLCMALLAASPAIDNADPNDFPPVDQRGYPRPFGSGPDIGAYEYGATLSALPYLNAQRLGTNLVLSFAAAPATQYRLQWSPDLTTWTDLSTNGPVASTTNITQTVSTKGASQRFFRLVTP